MNAFFIAAGIAILAFVPMPALQAVLATAASTLFESTPFILAGALLASIVPRRGAHLGSLLGCGCGSGPGARSLVVAAATALAFGPLVAIARFALASLIARRLAHSTCAMASPTPLSELLAVLPCALFAGVIFSFVPVTAVSHVHPAIAAVLAAVLTALASPCGLGAVALAASLRTAAPAACIAVLAVAGVCDLRALRARSHAGGARHDAFAYALAAAACAIVAYHHGGALVNPRFTLALWGSAAILLVCSIVYRAQVTPHFRWAGALMFCAALLGAPPPVYYATETTLNDAFAGETLDFYGAVAGSGAHTSLVRYAITCCRADAQPVTVRMTRPLREPAGTWVRARGVLVRTEDGLALSVRRYTRTAAPADPFVYR